jgi:polyphosphate kinase
MNIDQNTFPKELSWLSFNERVLQEAEDKKVPIIDRVHYLGIFSNNLDEFFRVRVADVRRLAAFAPGKERERSAKLYDKIQKRVLKLQRRFDNAYLDVLKDLRRRHIYLINEQQLKKKQVTFVEDFFYRQVLPVLKPILFTDDTVKFPELTDGSIYFAIKLTLGNDKVKYAVLEIPTPPLDRFIIIPSEGSRRRKALIVLDNIIRHNLKEVFRGTLDIKEAEAYTFKLTRDAELELGETITQSLIDKVSVSLKKRRAADPVRFVFDRDMPQDLLEFLVKQMGFGRFDSLMGGGRYHNSRDFMSFPNLGPEYLEYRRQSPVPVNILDNQQSFFQTLQKTDIMLYYPYHSFRYVEDLLYSASLDPAVKSIKITLYRLASDSHIANALINARNNNKEVTAVMELQARFDEQANIQWANRLTEAGVNVIFGIPGLKVHSKLISIARQEGNTIRYYSHVGTGNFNEKTARVYTDLSLLTYNQQIGKEIDKVFEFLTYNYKQFDYKKLLVSPNSFRPGLMELIDREIENKSYGRKAGIFIKCNNLVDQEVVEKLYDASKAGVKVRLIVRGMCSLIPGVKGLSENIEGISIVDRYLEHTRIYRFENEGDPHFYISSADLMTRNLDYRVEVTCPIEDDTLKQFLNDILELQWKDRAAARIIDSKQQNVFKPRGNKKKVRSQEETISLVKRFSARELPPEDDADKDSGE